MLSRSSDWTTKSITIVDRPVPVSVTFTKDAPIQEFNLFAQTTPTRLSVNVAPSAIEVISVSVTLKYEYRDTGGSLHRGSANYDVQIAKGYTTGSADISSLYQGLDIVSVDPEIKKVKGESGNTNIVYKY